jgi:DNA transformation protein
MASACLLLALFATLPRTMTHTSFVEQCLELLSGLGEVRARKMFGGHGLYAGESMVALIAFGCLYLKVDDATRLRFEAAGGVPFVYDGKGKPITMSYWTVPPEAMESPAEMLPWARLAQQAALAARANQAAQAAQAARPAPRPKTKKPARRRRG